MNHGFVAVLSYYILYRGFNSDFVYLGIQAVLAIFDMSSQQLFSVASVCH